MLLSTKHLYFFVRHLTVTRAAECFMTSERGWNPTCSVSICSTYRVFCRQLFGMRATLSLSGCASPTCFLLKCGICSGHVSPLPPGLPTASSACASARSRTEANNWDTGHSGVMRDSHSYSVFKLRHVCAHETSYLSRLKHVGVFHMRLQCLLCRNPPSLGRVFI